MGGARFLMRRERESKTHTHTHTPSDTEATGVTRTGDLRDKGNCTCPVAKTFTHTHRENTHGTYQPALCVAGIKV